MRKIRIFILVLIVVFFINNLSIFSYGFATMRCSKVARDFGGFFEVLDNDNPNIEYYDYSMRNWSKQNIDFKNSKEILDELQNIECRKLSRFFSSIICFLQNKNNSTIEIVLKQIDAKIIETPLEKTQLEMISGSVYSCEIVKMFNQYFLICYFIDSVEVDDLFTIAVYAVETIEGSKEKLDGLKSDNELFEKRFPEYLSYYMNSIQCICFWYLSMVIETFLIFYLVGKTRSIRGRFGKTEDSSVIEP